MNITGYTLKHPHMSGRTLGGDDQQHLDLWLAPTAMHRHTLMERIAGKNYTPDDSAWAHSHAANLYEWLQAGYIVKDGEVAR